MSRHCTQGTVPAFFLITFLAGLCVPAKAADKASEQRSSQKTGAQSQLPVKEEEDPFADVTAPNTEEKPKESSRSWRESFFKENFGFRKEIMSQFTSNQDGELASRQSLGFEVLKKFSTATETVASFNMQGRLVRRDGFNPVLNDMEGENRRGWAFEYHNLYLDFYNVLNPLLSDEEKGKSLGRFNVRAGRFYVPFGLNLQTDTHGTVLQLSNDRSFGFERDWYTGLWGALNKHVNYDVYYLAGSGYDLKYKGQSGLGAVRLSLGNRYSSEHGLEGGFSVLGGERLSNMAPGGATHATTMKGESAPRVVRTERAGLDGRYRRAVPTGLVTFTSEVSGGRDSRAPVFSQLHQGEYIHSSRKWGVATQYRRFSQDARGADSSIIGELSWYFKNDVGNSSLHWIKLNVERQLERMEGPPSTVITLQYYFYR